MGRSFNKAEDSPVWGPGGNTKHQKATALSHLCVTDESIIASLKKKGYSNFS